MRIHSLLRGVVPLSIAIGVSLMACSNSSSSSGNGGSGTGGGTGGGSSGSGGDCFDYSSFDATSKLTHFKADVLPIFRQSCGLSSSCHGDPNSSVPSQHYLGPAISDPDPSAALIQMIFDGSVGKASVENPDMDVIKPSDPKNSFIMYKLDGDPMSLDGVNCSSLSCVAGAACGLPMPSGGPQLSADARNTIRRWIAQGAKND